jgi:DNA-binding protein HU-beta
MLTKTLADQIVRQCIREVVRTKQSTGRRATLGEMGVASPALVALLRKAVLRELAARGFRMPSSGLVMNQRTVFAELVGKIAAQSMPLKKTHVAIKSGGSKPITKTALVRAIAKKLELTNKQTATFLELLAQTAVKETKKIGEFTIPGIGKLVKAERKVRLGRNPQTGESIKIKGKTVVKFRVAKVAKDTIAPVKK